jgi:hypothetical protein
MASFGREFQHEGWKMFYLLFVARKIKDLLQYSLEKCDSWDLVYIMYALFAFFPVCQSNRIASVCKTKDCRKVARIGIDDRFLCSHTSG